MKILLFSDTHFSLKTNLFRTEDDGLTLFFKTQLKVFDTIEKLIEKEKIDYIFFLGDLFHKKGIINVKVFNSVKNKFYELSKKVPIKMIVGNHDQSGGVEINSVETFNLIDNIEVINNYKKIEMEGKIFHFQSYTKDELKFEIEEGKPNYLFNHISFIVAEANKDYVMNDGHSVKKVNFFKKVFSGHFHKYQELKNIIYIGSIFQNNFGESENTPYFIIWDTEKDQIKKIENKKYIRFINVYSVDELKKLKIKKTDYVKIITDDVIPDEYKNKVIWIKPPKKKTSRIQWEGNESIDKILEKYVEMKLEKSEEEKKKYLEIGLGIVEGVENEIKED